MKFVPKPISRLAGRSALKLSKASPTLLVVGGVVGLGSAAVMAAVATRKIEPVLNDHKAERAQIGEIDKSAPKEVRRDQQTQVLELYYNTGIRLTRIYGPAIAVGTISAVSILSGHRILNGRYAATLAAYTSLSDQFNRYRGRVTRTLGEAAERDIYNGAHGEWVEDPDNKGQYKLKPKFEEEFEDYSFLRPWFDETNVHWSRDADTNYYFLKTVQQHHNDLLAIRGHVFLNEVLDALHMPRTKEGAVTGWVRDNKDGDGFIDFGFMTGDDPHTVAFRNKAEKTVRLNFNVDGVVWNLI